MRTEFKKNDLYGSAFFYYPILDKITHTYEAYCLPIQGQTIKVNLPLNQKFAFTTIFDCIGEFNRAFLELLEKGDLLVSFSLLRLQIENLTVLFAETKWPFYILHKIYNGKNQIDQIKKNGEYIKPAELRKEIDKIYNVSISKLYCQYCSFVHPSNEQDKVRFTYNQFGDEIEIVDTEYINNKVNDMITVNQTITEVLLDYLDMMKEELETQLEKYAESV